jgi:tetratricopeptide (TPR) repeat protein
MSSGSKRLTSAVLCALLSGCAHSLAAGSPDQTPALTADQLMSVAAAAEQLGDRLRAQQYLLAARKAGADPTLVLRRSLRLYVADGQYRLAIDSVQDHLRSHPQQRELRFLLAQLYEATQLDAAAMAEYERVLALEPSEPRAHFALATLLRERAHDPVRADQHYRAFLALAPDAADAPEARSHLLQELP